MCDPFPCAYQVLGLQVCETMPSFSLEVAAFLMAFGHVHTQGRLMFKDFCRGVGACTGQKMLLDTLELELQWL